MLQELDDTVGAAYAMDSVAYIHRHLGDRHQAVACYQQARDLYREVGESEGEAEALTHLGDIHHENGDVDAARDAWRQALDILSQLGHPGAEQVRAKLTPPDCFEAADPGIEREALARKSEPPIPSTPQISDKASCTQTGANPESADL